jgi:hypothetical protein
VLFNLAIMIVPGAQGISSQFPVLSKTDRIKNGDSSEN